MAGRTAKHLLQVLLQASEKSAKIARAWRCQEELFELMIEEKAGIEKNKRFIRDFKTLADVLVQEVVKNDVIQEFPELSGFIFGEESNKFMNSAGQEIRIEVQKDSSATSKHLVTVLDGNESAAQLLADLIHADISLETEEIQTLKDKLDFELPLDELAIWIDPIDCTAQYTSNSPGKEIDGIVVSGLPCATVLIGIFHQGTGLPVAGVINQPFCTATKDKQNNLQWKGRRFWGVTYNKHCCYFLGNDLNRLTQDDKVVQLSSSSSSSSSSFKIAVSRSESEDVKKTLLTSGASIFTISGVGHKLLQVIDANVDFYVLSHPSSFKWDTCAADAILSSMGGGVIAYNKAVALKSAMKEIDETSLNKCRLRYHTPDDKKGKKWSNTHGVIAFQSFPKVFKLLDYLS